MSVGIETAFSERSQLAMVRPLIKQAARCFDVPIFQVEEALSQAPHADALAAFCRAGGPQKLLIYMQPPGEDAEDDEEPLIYVSSGESDRFVERGVLLAKASAELELTSANVESEVSCNVVLGSPMKALLASIEQVYLPVLTASVPAWGAKLPEDVAPEFFGGIGKFVAVLADAVHGVEGGVELVKPSVRADNVDPKQKGFERAASNPELVASYEAAVLAWCDTVEELLDDVPPPATTIPDGEQGPSSELEHWKVRTSKFNSVAEQLRSKEHRTVLAVLTVARAPALRRWKSLDGPTACRTASRSTPTAATSRSCR